MTKTRKSITSTEGTVLVVNDPFLQTKVMTDWQLARTGTITIAEQQRIAKLAVGEVLELRRDFGNRVLRVSRAKEE